VTYIQVESTAAAAGIIAHNFYGQPSERLKLVGVTGTNGKTTIATLLYKLFSALGYKCGLLSTVQNHIAERIVPATHTTPDPLHLNALLKEMVDAGCTMFSWRPAPMPSTSNASPAFTTPAASSAISPMTISIITKPLTNTSG
jgi:UDP-N-acetylmuramyl tripeptide synthase